LGVLGGMLGSLFINVNTRMGRLRKRFVNTKLKKIIETGLYAGLTISIAFWCTAGLNVCKENPKTYTAENLALHKVEEEVKTQNTWICPDKENTYSPIATLFFNTEKGVIRSLFTANE